MRSFRSGEVEIEVLAPDSILLLGGVGERDDKGRVVTSNSMSVVLGLTHRGHRVALLTGDVDEVGLGSLLEDGQAIEAKVLVFPHHGGRPSGIDSRAFAEWLCALVKPELVIFSTDRDRYSNPRPEIVDGVKATSPDAHILCTQLSEECSLSILRPASHLAALPAHGKPGGKCCGGTVVVQLNGADSNYQPSTLHRNFVRSWVPDPMCRRS